MDVDPSRIPVEPIPFEHGLTRFAEALAGGRARIVAIGSSTTAGDDSQPPVPPYPGRLKVFLEEEYRPAVIDMVNKGVRGEEAPKQLARFDTDVIAHNPDLVIWQVGTNAVWQAPEQNPPTFNETTRAIRDGLVKLRADAPQADVVLMDLQYVPAVLTPAKKDRAIAMVESIGELARDAGVNVFRRFAFQKGLHQVEGVSFDRMVNPADARRLHDGEWVTDKLARVLRIAIVGGVNKVRYA